LTSHSPVTSSGRGTKGKPNNFTPGPSDGSYALETIQPIPDSDVAILTGRMSGFLVKG